MNQLDAPSFSRGPLGAALAPAVWPALRSRLRLWRNKGGCGATRAAVAQGLVRPGGSPQERKAAIAAVPVAAGCAMLAAGCAMLAAGLLARGAGLES